MNNVIFVVTVFGDHGTPRAVVYGQRALDVRLADARRSGDVVSVRLADPL